MDFNGRVLSLKIKIDNFTFQILNLDAPNAGNQLISEGFMEDVQYHLDPTVPALICGDFNMVEDTNKDRRGGRPRIFHTHGVEALKKLKADYSLLDIWHEKHSNDSAWLLNVKKCYIHPFSNTESHRKRSNNTK